MNNNLSLFDLGHPLEALTLNKLSSSRIDNFHFNL